MDARSQSLKKDDELDLWAIPEVLAMFGRGPQAGAPAPLERLRDTVQAHINAETGLLTTYKQLAATTRDPVMALLLNVVLDDEERHHTLLERMAARLHASLNWLPAPDALPTGSEPAPAPSDDQIATLRALAEHEEEGARQMRRIAAQEGDLYGGLFTVLLEAMAMDSEKHAHLLRFLQRRAQQQARR
jgi:hypothetical protein